MLDQGLLEVGDFVEGPFGREVFGGFTGDVDAGFADKDASGEVPPLGGVESGRELGDLFVSMDDGGFKGPRGLKISTGLRTTMAI